MHQANAAAAPTRRRLDEQWKGQALSLRTCLRESIHRPTAPRGNGYLQLLCQPFRGDLVAKTTHYVRRRPDENNVHRLTKIREGCVFRHKAPSHPDRICPRSRKRLFEPPVVEITTLWPVGIWVDELGTTDRHCLVCFADEHGMTVGLCEESD